MSSRFLKLILFYLICGLAVRRLPRMQEIVGSNPTEGKIRFSQFEFTLFYRVECKNLCCKTNIKLKVLKLNKTKLKYVELCNR